MKYTYFISFVWTFNGEQLFDNKQVECSELIQSLEAILSIEKLIVEEFQKDGFDLESLSIINFQLLRAEKA